MSNTLKLIERVRATTDRGTDYAVAKALGIQQTKVIAIKRGLAYPGPKAQIRMAQLLKIDLQDIVALINEDKAKTEAERLHWRSLCSARLREAFDAARETLGPAFIAAALILGSGIARTVDVVSADHAIHYAHRLRRWLRGWSAAAA